MLKDKIVTERPDSCKARFPLDPKCFISNSSLPLVTHLANELSSPIKKSILRKIIVTSTSDTKDFLTQHLTPLLDVTFGLRFLTLPQACMLFAKMTKKPPLDFPSHINLMLHLESLITSLLRSSKPEIAPLQSYINGSKKRILSLAEHLSHVFLSYGTYSKDALPFLSEISPWQHILWEEVSKHWLFPSSFCEEMISPKIVLDIHLFGLSYIPPLLQNYLTKLEAFWPFTYYFHSPTPYFWMDILSEKTVARLDKTFEKKNIAPSERLSFKTITEDTNLLLANLGELGKSTLVFANEKQTHEAFLPPPETTTLSCLQANIFHMRKDVVPFSDLSIQIHEAPSHLREVEVLVHNLEEFLYTQKVPLEKIRVFVADIDAYFPFIRLIFEGEDAPFGYKITDVSALLLSHYYKTLKLFFSLADSRFEKALIYELFSSPFFKEKHGLTDTDLIFFDEVLQNANVQWGFDQEMKASVLEDRRADGDGSFSFAFKALTKNLPFLTSHVDLSKAELLGKFIFLVETLYQDISRLKTDEKDLLAWIEDLSSLVLSYFIQTDETKIFLKELSRVSDSASFIHTSYSFASFQKILEEIFSSATQNEYFSEKPTLHFSPIADVDITEYDAIFILGLDEISFPRKSSNRSLNVLKKHPSSTPQPSITTKDRYFFLRSLLAAKEALIVSFTGISTEDQKPIGPSLVIKELMGNVAGLSIKRHPPFFFSKFYTEGTYFSKKAETLARAFYYKVPKTVEVVSQKERKEGVTLVDVKDLIKLVRHPIQFFANKSLGIYLKNDKSSAFLEREFFLSYLDKAMIRSKSLFTSKEKIFEEMERKNLLPTALFRGVARQELLEEMNLIQENLSKLSLTDKSFFSLTFDPAAKKEQMLTGKRKVVPAIFEKTDRGEYLIYGTVDPLLREGVCTHGKNEIKEIWKYWPHLLLLARGQGNLSPSLFSLKDGTYREIKIFDETLALHTLLDYYKAAQENISPLMPDRIKPLIEKKTEDLTLNDHYLFEDPYLDLFKPDLSHPWEPYLEALCKSLIV